MTKPLLRALGCLVLLAFVFSLGLPAVAGAASKAPAGFIALSESAMNWDDAKAFCQQQGGSLPRINDSDSFGVPSRGDKIDGFGAPGATWPSGLPRNPPSNRYWTGTENSGNPAEYVWIITNFGPEVFVKSDSKNGSAHAICVRTVASGPPIPPPPPPDKEEKEPTPGDAAKPRPADAEKPKPADPAKPKPGDAIKPAPADAASKLPAGFIAVAPSTMYLPAAKAFCEQQGGRLPRINNRDSWDPNDWEKGMSVEGFGTADLFGTQGDPWPSGLPFDGWPYWTGTENSSIHSSIWCVEAKGGKVKLYSNHENALRRVACVPK